MKLATERRLAVAQMGATIFLLIAAIAYLGVAGRYYAEVRADATERRAPAATAEPLTQSEECRAALAYPGQTNAEKTWLRTCRDALATPPVPTPTPAPTPTPSPTAAPSTPAPSVTPTGPSTGCTGQANPACTGVPANWQPVITHTGDLTITQAGSTWTDVRVNGSIFVEALNVHLTRVEVIGGIIDNETDGTCYNGLTLDHVSVVQGATYSNLGNDGVVGPGGYTARDSKIESRVEGFRAGGKSDGCGVVTLINVYAHVTPPRPCPGTDWHGDGIQVYDGALDATNATLWLDEIGGCGGTAPYFQAGATFNNSPPRIRGMLVRGGGYSFRLLMAGDVQNLHVVDGSWSYGPVDVICSALTAWSADVVSIDANWQIATVVRTIPCPGLR